MARNPRHMDNLKNLSKGTDSRHYSKLPGSNRPWSIRNQMRHLAAQEADPTDKNAMRNIITQGGTRIPTVAETIAAAVLSKASNGNIQAANTAMDSIEGKLVQPTSNADMKTIENMTEEELREFIADDNEAPSESLCESGSGEAAGTQSDDAEAEPENTEAGDTGEIQLPVATSSD